LSGVGIPWESLSQQVAMASRIAWVANQRLKALEQNKKYCSSCHKIVEQNHASSCRKSKSLEQSTVPTIATLALPSVTIRPGIALHPAIVAKIQRSISESLSQYLKSLPVAVADLDLQKHVPVALTSVSQSVGESTVSRTPIQPTSSIKPPPVLATNLSPSPTEHAQTSLKKRHHRSISSDLEREVLAASNTGTMLNIITGVFTS